MKEKQLEAVLGEVKKAVVGKDDCIEMVLCAFLAGGHVLIEDIPGVGKTTMARAFAKALDLTSTRVQFTPDVLPTDLTGFYLYDRDGKEAQFHPGAVFCNLLLADEINRTSPKTQSALLEVMEEGMVTIEGRTRRLEPPFFVLATQNPAGSIGTALLPESQMDRFMIQIRMGYPTREEEIRILQNKRKEKQAEIFPALTKTQFIELQRKTGEVYVHSLIYDYLVRLIGQTREHPMAALGCSPRASVAGVRMAQARAFFEGRDFVTPGDVQKIFPAVAGHRILLNARARMNQVSVDTVVGEILRQVKKPKES
ncbi:MAG: MoxR family ATPase [Lachnospiraceae bacterium]|nr:MoxR family ATPase [Lachnospiraceae bacterium]